MARDLQKKFENFDGSQDRGVFLREVAEIIRTTDVPQELKDIVNRYDGLYGSDPATYSRNAQVPYFEAIRKKVTELLPSPNPPVQGSGKRNGKKTRKTRKSRKTRRYARRR